MLTPVALTRQQRERIFDKVTHTITKQYYDPLFNGTDWPNLARGSKSAIIADERPDEFESAVHGLVRRLETSHTGFFHQSVRRVPARLAIGATFSKPITAASLWVAHDVHPGSPAEKAGLRPGDGVLTVDGRSVLGAEQLTFPMGSEWTLLVRRGASELALQIAVPNPKSRKQPHCSPTPITYSRMENNIGYLKVSIFPTLLGLDLARQIDEAIGELSKCDALVLDLRGNLGGGLGVLRLMSYLSPAKLPIGYTVTRKRAQTGYNKDALPKLAQLPTHLPNALATLRLAAQFAGRDSSVLLVSEGLGFEKWHGRIAILVNEHTASAGEMVAAFAAENGLATIIGTQTAGRLIPGSAVSVGAGYMLILPKAEYVTWRGRRFEGEGVTPDIRCERGSSPLADVADSVLLAAVEHLGN